MINVHRLGGPRRYSFYYTFNPLLTDEDEFVSAALAQGKNRTGLNWFLLSLV
ncbi:hypothetical protein LAV72_08780 [Lysinibacillus xylanilyticus]|uniref:hypothetical protein n=1 Tax=Lysinibacillus xylanilyticus TaxID=582475 RepID=UPI002B246F54|nr:hypothetical protein [Lysinibacillus xylanilyticus]MEB2299717.1 hypothetical protein [Lysinibacillus xylanilyticus]